MRKKTIIILLVCMLVIPSTIVSSEQIDIKKTSTNYTDDVPIWKNGERWIYSVSEFWANYTYQGINIQMIGTIDDFTWTVSDTSGSTYTVDITGTVTATYEIHVPVGSIVLNLNGTLDPSSNKLKGTIIFDKTNLNIIDFNAVITGITSIKLLKLPIKFTLPIKISADGALSTPIPLFDFPLHAFKFWNLPELDITTDLNIGGIFGLINKPLIINTHYDWTPLAFCCLYQTNITVDAGTYDAWRILSLIGGYFDYYYAPAVGNIVKFDFNLPHGGIKAELKNHEITTYNINEK